MHTRAIVLAIVLFVVIVAGMFTFAYIKRTELKNTETPITQNVPPATPYDSIIRIDTKHFFENGVHTLVGEVDMPTACDLLETRAIVAESFPEQVGIDFTVINNDPTCEAKITKQRFKVTFNASEGAVITARFMGRPVVLNMIPPAEGETPDQFELYIKG